jgi:hypothetical protein
VRLCLYGYIHIRIYSIQTDAGLNDITVFANAGVYPDAFFSQKWKEGRRLAPRTPT